MHLTQWQPSANEHAGPPKMQVRSNHVEESLKSQAILPPKLDAVMVQWNLS